MKPFLILILIKYTNSEIIYPTKIPHTQFKPIQTCLKQAHTTKTDFKLLKNLIQPLDTKIHELCKHLSYKDPSHPYSNPFKPA